MTEQTADHSDEGDVSNATPEGDIPDATPDEDVQETDTPEGSDFKSEQDPETFPREYVEKLRTENGKYRQRAGEADTLAKRLHTELVRATGRLADPTDLPFDEDHLADADKMAGAINELLEAKPHLATRRPTGDIGQGQRGPASGGFSLLDILKERT
ncbi:hypothetical protein [Mycolicibacterium fortuitum]|jgi:hypothetical protein|uniref:hypothetical protein n=1 Tax=Mycolicibacterium fortuitum TaxID=1766 RepID=UPI003AAE0E32